jgi:hypothetical protein
MRAMDNRLDNLIRRFSAAARAHNTSLEEMNADAANRQAALLHQLHERIREFGEPGISQLRSLLQTKELPVAAMAAVYLLTALPTEALPVLRKCATTEGLLGFRSSVALERWEKGEWLPEQIDRGAAD